MVKYILKRVLLGILTLFVLIAITFAMTKVMPGSPLQSKNISGDVLKKMEATYGLDKPPVERMCMKHSNFVRELVEIPCSAYASLVQYLGWQC